MFTNEELAIINACVTRYLINISEDNPSPQLEIEINKCKQIIDKIQKNGLSTTSDE